MKCAVLGCGVVGSGVADILLHNADVIKEKTNVDLELKYILDIRDFPECEYTPFLTKNVDEIIDDEEVEIVAEAMGGVDPAFDFVSRCLRRGKHVTTSNKELVAKKGDVLFALARENNVNFMFEASVGGGIPIIRPISRCLAANRISEVAGILNGTTNFILNKMIIDGMTFADALVLAQKKGYAEKDPTADVEGLDACRKICILASLVFGSHVFPDERVFTEGISKITPEDVRAADSLGYAVKLIAQAKKLENEKIKILVSPTLVKKSSILGNVNGVFNACLVRGDMIGETVMTGPGAGKEATASAVVGDMIDMAEHAGNRKFFGWGNEKPGFIEDLSSIEDKFFLRLKGDRRDLAASIGQGTAALENGETVFITKPMTPSALDAALNGAEVKARIRVFE